MTDGSLTSTRRSLARAYAGLAEQSLGDHLTSIALFGSVARGEPHACSDIDLLVVLRDPPASMLHRRALLEPIRARLLPQLEELWQQAVYADFVELIRSESQARSFHPLYLEMARDAQMLFDRGGFLESVLNDIRAHIDDGRIEQRSLGSLRYWDLVPAKSRTGRPAAGLLVSPRETTQQALERGTLILEEVDFCSSEPPGPSRSAAVRKWWNWP